MLCYIESSSSVSVSNRSIMENSSQHPACSMRCLSPCYCDQRAGRIEIGRSELRRERQRKAGRVCGVEMCVV